MDPSSQYYFTPTVLGPKRSHVEFESASELPPDVINPLSHRPGTLKQFRVAGHSELKQVPRRLWAKFPHKGFNEPDAEAEGEDMADDAIVEDGEEEDEVYGTQRGKLDEEKVKGLMAREKVYAQAREAITIWIQQGHIRKAKKLMGIFVHSHEISFSSARNEDVDLRQHGLWGLMTEVLMRDGEDEDGGSDQGDPSEPVRWGSAKNMPRVREFLSFLIARYPYNRDFPHQVSALHFWPALLNTEVYNTHAEQVSALHRLETRARERQEAIEDEGNNAEEGLLGLSMLAEDGEGLAGSEEDFQSMILDMEDQYRAKETERIRREALRQIENVLGRLEPLMEKSPYKTDKEMLNLWGMTLLYVADLHVPASASQEKEKGQRKRENIRMKAKGVLLGQLAKAGGSVAYKLESFLRDKVEGEVDTQDDDTGDGMF